MKKDSKRLLLKLVEVIVKVNIREKFQLFDEYWTPKIVGEVNGSYIKLFKAKGDFVWHRHDNEDEFFLVMKGVFHIRLNEKAIILKEGEFFVVPKGVDHMPYAPNEAHVVLFEPKNVVNTGDQVSNKTVSNPEWI